jgi:hypothetical protein
LRSGGIVRAVAARALGWEKANIKKGSILVIAFDKPADMVLAVQSQGPQPKELERCVQAGDRRRSERQLVPQAGRRSSPAVADPLQQGQSAELDRFNALLSMIDKGSP